MKRNYVSLMKFEFINGNSPYEILCDSAFGKLETPHSRCFASMMNPMSSVISVITSVIVPEAAPIISNVTTTLILPYS